MFISIESLLLDTVGPITHPAVQTYPTALFNLTAQPDV